MEVILMVNVAGPVGVGEIWKGEAGGLKVPELQPARGQI